MLKAVSGSEPDWKVIYELINRITAAEDTNSALTLLTEASTRAVAVDRGAALFTMKGQYPWCIRWPDYATQRIRDFNTYYSGRVPVHFSGMESVLGPVVWSRYRDTEYVTDFHRPMGIRSSVGIGLSDSFSWQRYVVWLHRNGAGPQFSDREIQTLTLLCEQAARVISLKSEIDAAKREALSDPELGPDADVLSKRETEVARLICRRLSMREIAGLLRISPRTVERHALHIYYKLGVANRTELARLLCSRVKDAN